MTVATSHRKSPPITATEGFPNLGEVATTVAPPPPALPDRGMLRASAWDVVAGQGMSASDLRDWLEELETDPHLRSAATLRAIERIRKALELMPEEAGLGDPVVLTLRDVVVLTRLVLSRLR